MGWGGIEKVLQFGITFFCGVVDMMVSYQKIPVISSLLSVSVSFKGLDPINVSHLTKGQNVLSCY